MSMTQEINGRIEDELWNALTKSVVIIPEERRAELIHYLASHDAFRPGHPPSEDHHRAVIRHPARVDVYYAVNDKEFSLLQRIIELIMVAAAAADEPLFQRGIATIGFVIRCYLQFDRSKISLETWQALPLIALSKAKPRGITLEALAEQAKMAPQVVREALQSLQDARKANGERTALVEEHDGHWYAVDV